MPSPEITNSAALTKAKRELDRAREDGDELKIALAEAALNDLLDRASDVTHVTRNTNG